MPRVSLFLLAVAATVPLSAPAADFVIQISVDGLGSSYLQALIALGEAPHFARFQTEGAFTNNARTDFDFTITLPNHTAMITGRPVFDKFGVVKSGHEWTNNVDPNPGETLATNHGAYVASTFDVAHDHGLLTALYATKSKFVLYDQSYNQFAGAPDLTGPDNGQDKIDRYVNAVGDSPALMASLLGDLSTTASNYSFVHFHDTDAAGHGFGWGSQEYNNAVKAVDGYLGQVFDLIDTNPVLHNRTAIILSADHGGNGLDHSPNDDPLDYTIPFYVWGPGVAAGADLYSLNLSTRLDPGAGRPDYTGTNSEPIRNGDGGNLALNFLGLGPIPGSSINAAQNLAVPEPSDADLLVVALALFAVPPRRRFAVAWGAHAARV